jgi:hypothetical protein
MLLCKGDGRTIVFIGETIISRRIRSGRHVIAYEIAKEIPIVFDCLAYFVDLGEGDLGQQGGLVVTQAVHMFLSIAQILEEKVLVAQEGAAYIVPMLLLVIRKSISAGWT